MTEFYPPIESRNTDELIGIAHNLSNDYSTEAIEQAQKELVRRQIAVEKQHALIKKWETERRKSMKKIDSQYAQQCLLNEAESYSVLRMTVIFFMSVFYVTGRFFGHDTLSYLRKNNYKRKFRQRLILLTSGTLFWIVFCWGAYKISEKQWQKEVQKTDVSDWIKSRSDYQKELRLKQQKKSVAPTTDNTKNISK
jgi:hypothetical protein